ncbi:MAG: hypothetical protein IJ846_01645 [Alphaproteobacteria bacterium]|nr:hypothetical protein [Alphaproteobacteria bacterium]
MSDKLEWMNRHFVLLRHKELDDVCKIEGYKIRPDIQSFFDGKTDAEEIVWNFADAGRWKCACELLAYMAHRRAAVWWAYQCLLSLNEELEVVPAEERDIDSIATSFEPEVPDFAKVEPPKLDPARVADLEAQVAQMQADYQNMRAMVDPKMMKMIEDGLKVAFQEFKKVHGHDPMELMDMFTEKLKDNSDPIDRDSPIFKAADEIKPKLMQVRQETLDTIHAVIPPKVPEHEKKVRDDALQAVYRWIVSPDEVNAKKALDIGNECPDTPAGLLSFCAFWAGGNLMPDPDGDQVVPTPAGLAANGISQVLLMCALHKGGTRKLKERYEHYFNLGVEVMTGENNWEESVIEGEAPHNAESSESTKIIEKNADAGKIAPAEEKQAPAVYKRWKPE